MNKIYRIFSFLTLCIFCILSTHAQKVSVMTFNIRLDAASDGDNIWNNRKGAVVDMLNYYQPDLLGMQEVCPNQMDDFKIKNFLNTEHLA